MLLWEEVLLDGLRMHHLNPLYKTNEIVLYLIRETNDNKNTWIREKTCIRKGVFCMNNKKVIVSRWKDLDKQSNSFGKTYEYDRYKFIKGEDGFKSNIAFLRLPPKKAAFPLHYHEYSEETFYIISGEGVLETKEGKQEVKTGDIIFFPTGSEGMHKLTNNSAVEDLLYIDFDTYVPLDITYYPGKDKIGIFGEHYTGVLRKTSAVDLYEGEEDN